MELYQKGILFGTICCTFLLQYLAHCQGPPKVSGSFLAYGEIVETLEDTSGIMPQIAFEESYNADTENAAFSISSMGMNVTFVENFKTNQAFRYADNDECALLNVSEWVNTDAPPSLLHYESTNNTVRFSLKQLFSLDDKHLIEKDMPASLRGIPARKWMYEIVGKEDDGTMRKLNIYAFWSDESWLTPAASKLVPLGFIVTKFKYGNNEGVKVHEQFINVFAFLNNTYNHKAFEPMQWIYCENRVQTLKFPNVNGFQALSLHSEFILPDYSEIKYLDNWFDPKNKLLRSDYERLKEEDPIEERNERRYQSEIVIGQMGVVFRLTYFKGRGVCKVIQAADYDFDIQNLFNIKLDKWSVGKMFGLNDTTYVYTGKTMKRNIPCHVFQGIRKDWPEPSANVTSLWEWCFNTNMTDNDNVQFRDGEFGLVNAQIKILKSELSGFEAGYRIIHHFYHVNNDRDLEIMDATSFEISRCFRERQKRALQFASTFKIDDDNLYLVENATSDTSFLQKWRAVIYQHTTIPAYSLRISQVRTTVINKKLYVKFLILDVHDDLRNMTPKQVSAQEAESKLRESIDKNRVFISHNLKPNSPTENKPDKFIVQKDSLRSQLNTTFKPHTLPPVPSQSPTTSSKPFTLRTVHPHTGSTRFPDETDGTSDDTSGDTTISPGPTTLKPTDETTIKYKGHQKGAVAGVSIAMLLVGISIGSFGTFYKYNGLPPCLKINA